MLEYTEPFHHPTMTAYELPESRKDPEFQDVLILAGINSFGLPAPSNDSQAAKIFFERREQFVLGHRKEWETGSLYTARCQLIIANSIGNHP